MVLARSKFMNNILASESEITYCPSFDGNIALHVGT